jgi:type III secretion system (T3SS) SseB-like protein
MDTPHFYLIGGQDYLPLEVPRRCCVHNEVVDSKGAVHLVVHIYPELYDPESLFGAQRVSLLLLSPANRSQSPASQLQWPIPVLVGQILDDDILSRRNLDETEVHYFAKADLHLTCPKPAGSNSSTGSVSCDYPTLLPPVLDDVGFTVIREQSGPVADEFKASVTTILSRDRQVVHAYLICLRYGNSAQEHVGLCLLYEGDKDQIAHALAREFSAMFNAKESLDIIIISDHQDWTLSLNCRPFYVR